MPRPQSSNAGAEKSPKLALRTAKFGGVTMSTNKVRRRTTAWTRNALFYGRIRVGNRVIGGIYSSGGNGTRRNASGNNEEA